MGEKNNFLNRLALDKYGEYMSQISQSDSELEQSRRDYELERMRQEYVRERERHELERELQRQRAANNEPWYEGVIQRNESSISYQYRAILEEQRRLASSERAAQRYRRTISLDESFLSDYKFLSTTLDNASKKKSILKKISNMLGLDDDGNITVDSKVVDNPTELGLLIIQLGKSLVENNDIRNIDEIE